MRVIAIFLLLAFPATLAVLVPDELRLIALVLSSIALYSLILFLAVRNSKRTRTGTAIFTKSREQFNIFGFLFFGIFFTVYTLNNHFYYDAIALAAILVIFNIAFYALTNKSMHVLAINQDEMLFNHGKIIKRNISDLKSITYNGFTGNICLKFHNDTSIVVGEQDVDDEQQFQWINLIIQKAGEHVFISDNLKNVA